MMKMKTLLSLLFVTCFITGTILAQDWEIYDASVIPVDYGFGGNGGSANSSTTIIYDPAIPGNKLLQFISPDTDSQFSFTNSLPENVNDLTLAMRVRGIPSIDTLKRLFDLDVRFSEVNLREKFIIDYDDDIKFERSGESSEVENASDWHVWRFVCNGTDNLWSLYLDESPDAILQSASPDGTTNQYFKMGDGSGGNSMGAWVDWVVWDTTGAYSPTDLALPNLTGLTEDKPQVAFLTQTNWKYFDDTGFYADSLFVADLEDGGYEVTILDYNAYTTVNTMEANVLKTADLVILGRGISSGDFDDMDDVIWSEIKTPVILMSNYVARANRLGFFRSNDLQDFARLDTFYAEVVNSSDVVFEGLTIPSDGIIPYAEDYLGVTFATEDQLNGEVILRLEGIGTAFRINNETGDVTETFEMADYDENVLMARWSPGDSMYLSSPDFSGYVSSVAGGYRSYITVGHDREYDTSLGVRIRDYYTFTDFTQQVWMNEVANLISLSSAGNADLQSITIDGVPISFDPDNSELSYQFFAGTSVNHMPVVSALPKAEDATVTVTQPANAEGMSVITVTSDDGAVTKTYNLDLSVGEAEGVVIFVTNKEWLEFDTDGNYADSYFVSDLEASGYDVFVTPYSNYGTIDATEAAALEMADLVILGRGISSGDFDDADDIVWEQLTTPVVLMSNYVGRANRLGYYRSNDVQDFARKEIYSANLGERNDAIYTGISAGADNTIAYAEENLGIVIADESQISGKVLLSLAGEGKAYRIDSESGALVDSFELVDFNENVLMARWSPGDSMYMASADLPGFNSTVPAGYRTYMTVGHDREYDTDINARIRDYYSLTDAGNTLFQNELDYLIDISGENPAESKYALLTNLTVDGTTITGFDPLDFEYTLELFSGNPLPDFVGTTFSNDAAVSYDILVSSTDTVFVNVSSADGLTTLSYAIIIDYLDSNNETELINVNVYPNPVSDVLLVDLPKNNKPYNISVYNTYGQLMTQKSTADSTTKINMSGMNTGVYILNIEQDGKSFISKVVKD